MPIVAHPINESAQIGQIFRQEASMIGHPLAVLVIWIGLVVLLTACCLLGYMLVQARKSAAAQDGLENTDSRSETSVTAIEITALPDTDEPAEEVLEISSETIASGLLEYVPEAVPALLERFKDRVILMIPPEVYAQVESGQAGILTARDQPVRIVLIEKTNAGTICTPEQWSLPHCVDYVCSLWKMLGFVFGQMNTTRMRSTLANIHSLLQQLRQNERDKSLGEMNGNLKYLSELRESANTGGTAIDGQSYLFGTQLESIYRESLQSTSTYALVLRGNRNSLRAAKFSALQVNKETVDTLTKFISDYRADAHIQLSSIYCTATVVATAGIYGPDSGLAKVRHSHAAEALSDFEHQDIEWWENISRRLKEFDGTYSWQGTKNRARALLNTQMQEVREDIAASVHEIRRILKQTNFWITQIGQRNHAAMRLRLVGDGRHSLTRIELLTPVSRGVRTN
jgi:hypothetical protein